MPDPLTADIWWLIELYDSLGRDITREGCDCGASPEEYHSHTCVLQGIYGDLCEELDIVPLRNSTWTWQIWLDEAYLPWRWVCSSGEEWHIGGPINGPDHWCVRERRWVTQGE